MTYHIPAGAYAEQGVALLRVSTDRQFQEGESIETQRTRTSLVAERFNIEIVQHFAEHFSGRASNRQVLEEMFAYLGVHPRITVVIVSDIDRFTRGGPDVYLELKRRLASLGVRLMDAAGIIQPEYNRLDHLGFEYGWSKESPSRPAEIFKAETARTVAGDMLIRMIGQEINLSQQGYHCRMAPFGYQIKKIMTEEGKKKPILIPHPQEAKWIKSIYAMRSAGILDDKRICDQLNAQGFKTRLQNLHDPVTRRVIGKQGGRPLHPKKLQAFVRNTLYAGVKIERWTKNEPVKMIGEPLVTIDLWNKANRGSHRIECLSDTQFRILDERKKPGCFRHNPEFLLRHVVCCPTCGKPFHASKSKGQLGGKFGYFHCRRHKPAFSKPQKEFEATVGNCLESIGGKPGFLPLLKEIVREVWISKNRDTTTQLQDIATHKRTLKAKQQALIDKLIATESEIVTKRLEEQVEQIEETLKDLEQQKPKRALELDEIARYFELVKQAFEHPLEFVQKAETKAEIERAWLLIFAQNPTYQDLEVRTPDLTLIYRLNKVSKNGKDAVVREMTLNSNLFETQVRSALEAYSPCDDDPEAYLPVSR